MRRSMSRTSPVQFTRVRPGESLLG
jgi:hypothetical protein